MEFKLIKENEDGSADYQLHVTQEETSDNIVTGKQIGRAHV